MKPALGVTEPGAIAYACARAKSYVKGAVKHVDLTLNSGMYKNAFTCGIPHSPYVGTRYAAALGIVAGRWEKELESLEDVTHEDILAACQLIDEGKIQVHLGDIDSQIDIRAIVTTEQDECRLWIHGTHTHVIEIQLNGEIIYSDSEAKQALEEGSSVKNLETLEIPEIHKYTMEEIFTYCQQVPLEELLFIEEAYRVNLQLFEEGMKSERTTFLKSLLKMNGGVVISDQELATAQLLCNGTIEARVIGLDKPAMSITGSGAHGIICTMPLYAMYKVNGYSKEKLLRATALSYLVTMYIKEYSGRLSAFCGCGIAAGTGMACACTYLKGGDLEQMHRTVNNMASSITGMICDGGNQGCTMKGVAAVDTAFRSVELAMAGSYVENQHGINGSSMEETFQYMGQIASPGMIGTEKVIVEIFQEKQRK